MKAVDALKIGGILAAGVVTYLLVTRTLKAGGKVIDGAKKVLTEDLNPASTENIIYKATSAAVDTFAGDGKETSLGVRMWEFFNKDKVQAEKDMLKDTSSVSDTKKQLDAYKHGGPSMGLVTIPSNQSDAESARLRRGEAQLTAKSYAQNLFDMNYYGDIYGVNK